MKDGHVEDWELLGGGDAGGADADGDDAGELLDLWLDGDLEDAAAGALAQRLADEPGLRTELRRAAQLRRRVAGLPAALEPPRDLWPGIEDRLEAPHATVSRGPWGLAPSSPSPWRQALAAGLGVAMGAALTLAVLTGSKGESGAASQNSPAAQLAVSQPDDPASAAASPASYRPTGDDLSTQIEADFLRARESLWVELLARRDRLPPETWNAVVDNLGLLDRVIRELRQALEADPGNRRLERLLLSNHQRQLDVLNKVAREV